MKLVIETYIDPATISDTAVTVFNSIDIFLTVSFTIESVMKIIRNGFFVSSTSYLRDTWSILDFIIVSSSLIDLAVSSINLPILKVFQKLTVGA